MKFDFNKWNVPLIQEPNELMQKLRELNIIGRKIVKIKCVGLCYNFTEDSIEDSAYSYYEERNAKNLQEISDYDNIPNETVFHRYVEIDEPIIFYLDNGDRLEIDYSFGSTIKIGKNSLPENIECGINLPNADMNVVFSNCLGKEIKGFEVCMSNTLINDFTSTWEEPEMEDIESKEQNSYISSFKIHLNDYIYLEFYSFYDYGEVVVKERRDEDTRISWEGLKKGIIR